MCEIAMRTTVLIPQPEQNVDFLHCSLFKRGLERSEIFYTAEIPHPKGTVEIQVPLPSPSIEGWEFCVVGYERLHGFSEVCQGLMTLDTLISEGMFKFSSLQPG